MKIAFINYSYYNPNDKSDIPKGYAINKYKFDNRKFNQLMLPYFILMTLLLNVHTKMIFLIFVEKVVK